MPDEIFPSYTHPDVGACKPASDMVSKRNLL